jgi:hypothetical protein
VTLDRWLLLVTLLPAVLWAFHRIRTERLRVTRLRVPDERKKFRASSAAYQRIGQRIGEKR